MPKQQILEAKFADFIQGVQNLGHSYVYYWTKSKSYRNQIAANKADFPLTKKVQKYFILCFSRFANLEKSEIGFLLIFVNV